MFVYGPGGFSAGLIATTTTDVDLSHTAGFAIQQGLSFKDIAIDHQTTVEPGEYDIVANCVDSFAQVVKGTFTTKLWFTSATEYQNTDPSGTSTTTATPTTTGTSTGTSTSATDTSSSSSDTSSSTESTTSGETTFSTIPGDNGTPGGTGGGQAGNADAAKGLASTGVPTGYLVLLGVVLLGAGIVAVLLSRRRKREAVISAWPE
jgi:LPXTG-motif cell wall-anchored protein